jgi:hypothetical protein
MKKVKKTAKRIKKAKVEKKQKSSNKVKIGNFAFEPTLHPSFPEMVVITNAPKWAKHMLGKKYISSVPATKLINTMIAERVVDSGAKSAKSEIKSVVGDTLEQVQFVPVNVDYYGND